jgi:hypothetical protein
LLVPAQHGRGVIQVTDLGEEGFEFGEFLLVIHGGLISKKIGAT